MIGTLPTRSLFRLLNSSLRERSGRSRPLQYRKSPNCRAALSRIRGSRPFRGQHATDLALGCTTQPSLPVIIGREMNSIGGASLENPILISLRKNRQLLFVAETLLPAPPGQLSETQLMPPVVVSGGINVVS